MNLTLRGNDIIINNIEDFCLSQTLECGQCFRFTKLLDTKYIIIAKKKLLVLEQLDKELIFYNTSHHDMNQIWIDYFDLNTDYKHIKDYLISNDDKMEEVINKGAGIRILNQDFVEMLISFILSQNKQIPQIKQVIEHLCTKYGTILQQYDGVNYYDFPSLNKLSTLTEEDFKDCKAGFRAKYLVDACAKLASDSITEEDLLKYTSSEIRDKLCIIKGVGVKVSNCVMLYGLKQKDAFPIDVWIKRIMENIYFKEETKLEIIQSFAKEKFGDFGGYAQQYLFYYSRI